MVVIVETGLSGVCVVSLVVEKDDENWGALVGYEVGFPGDSGTSVVVVSDPKIYRNTKTNKTQKYAQNVARFPFPFVSKKLNLMGIRYRYNLANQLVGEHNVCHNQCHNALSVFSLFAFGKKRKNDKTQQNFYHNIDKQQSIEPTKKLLTHVFQPTPVQSPSLTHCKSISSNP